MRCKKHPIDLSSNAGVCASCLRERLIAIIAAQAQHQAQVHQAQLNVYHHKHFFSTPQIGPAGFITVEKINKDGKSTTKGGKFSSIFSNLFRSKSEKLKSKPDNIISGDSCTDSPSWFARMTPGRRKNQVNDFSGANRKTFYRNRGMSPSRSPDEEHCRGGYSSERQTPWRTPATRLSRNVSGFTFCLSPLVSVSGESRVTTKAYLSTQPSFCKSRSRKLADFGRYN